MISWLVGGRDGEYALAFMDEVRDRLANRVQLTTDGHKAYLNAVEEAFGADIDYAMLMKLYGEPEGKAVPQERRYGPAVCTGAKKTRIEGNPRPGACQHVAFERQNLTMRMQMRRFTRLRCTHRLVQLHPRSQDAENVAGNGRWPVQDTVVEGRLCGMMDAAAPKPGTARALQKRTAENSN